MNPSNPTSRPPARHPTVHPFPPLSVIRFPTLSQRRTLTALALASALLCTGSAVQAAEGAVVAQAVDAATSIVVTATRHPLLEVEAPAALTVITRRDIESRGADNLIEAIRGETGVSLQGRAIGGRKVISLRGMDSKHTLFLVDGRRVDASDGVVGHSDFQYDWVAVEDIERIEVVRGPLSVLYGSEAMGGVVNVITRQSGAQWRFGASAEGTLAEGGRGGDGHRVALRMDGPLAAGLGLRAGAAQTRRGAIASRADARISELEGREKNDGWLGLLWQLAAGQRVDAEYRETREERFADARERSGLRRYHWSGNLVERSLGSLAWDANWGAAAGTSLLSTQLRAYRSVLDVQNTRTNNVPVNPTQRLEDQVLEGQVRGEVASHDLVSGFEARNEALSDPGLPGGRSLARYRALYLQDELALTRALRLTLGLRYDQHSLFGHESSPRAYLVWHDGGPWTVKGGYSHGFKAPNLKQIVPGGRREGPNTVFGNPDLQPETSDGVEFGVGWRRGESAREVMLFDQRIDHLIELQLIKPGPVPGTGSFVYQNVVHARMRGVELGLAEPLAAGLQFGLAYNYLAATAERGQRLVQRPRHNVTLRLDGQHGAWRAGLRVEHNRDQLLAAAVVGQPPVPAPALTMISAQVTRTLPAGLELSLGVDNLSDVNLAAKSPLFIAAEPPRTWRVALRGRW